MNLTPHEPSYHRPAYGCGDADLTVGQQSGAGPGRRSRVRRVGADRAAGVPVTGRQIADGGVGAVSTLETRPVGVVVDPFLTAAEREALQDTVRRAELRRMRRDGGPQRPNARRWVGGWAAAVAVSGLLILVLHTLLASVGLTGDGAGDLAVGLALAAAIAVVCALGYRTGVKRAAESARLRDAFVEEDEIHQDDRPLLDAAREAHRSVLASRALATNTLDRTAVRMVLAEEVWALARHLAALGAIRTVLAPADGSAPPTPTPAIRAALADVRRCLAEKVRALRDYAAAVEALDERLDAVIRAEREAATRRSGREAADRAEAEAGAALTELRARLAGDRVVDQLRQLASEVEAARCAIPPPRRRPVEGPRA